MGHNCKLIFLFIWIYLLYIIGIIIFSKGFLLNRFDIEQNSTCDSQQVYMFENRSLACAKTNFKKAIFLIIDALRYDFAKFNKSILPHEEEPFQNKLLIFHELLSKYPKHARLYRFWADPPTTTMQRIKGLTTGSLPTFIDVSANFGSSSVTEDNIIHQFLKQGKKLIFMGDDTWNDLFPNTFHRAYFYPSLDFKDLHKVDNGVLEHLEPELQKLDWDVLIGHFLGVDHSGHRFGPYHAEMTAKLKQMDNVIRFNAHFLYSLIYSISDFVI